MPKVCNHPFLKTLAGCLTLTLLMPHPAFALRPMGTENAGLEEDLRQSFPAAAGVERALKVFEQKGIYQRLERNPVLLEIKEGNDASFEIAQRDVRSYSLNQTAEWAIALAPGIHSLSTATYSTQPRKPLVTEEEIVSYVHGLLDFAKNAAEKSARKRERISIVLKDANDGQFRGLLRSLAKTYSQSLDLATARKRRSSPRWREDLLGWIRRPSREEHAYGEVDPTTEDGRRILLLAAYLNLRGYVLDEYGRETIHLPSLFVDEEGHLFFVHRDSGDIEDWMISTGLYRLAYLLGKNFANVVETRFPAPRELKEAYSKEMRQLSQWQFDNPDVPFQRAASDYEKEELLIPDAKKARAARIVWMLWTGISDPHFYNNLSVDGVPIDFDFKTILHPMVKVTDIDPTAQATLLATRFLVVQTEEMDAYHTIEGYDLPTLADTIKKIVGYNSLWKIVNEVGYPSGFSSGDFRSPADTYRYFDNKRANGGEWLWEATALTLRMLTGEEISAQRLKEMSTAAGMEEGAAVPTVTRVPFGDWEQSLNRWLLRDGVLERETDHLGAGEFWTRLIILEETISLVELLVDEDWVDQQPAMERPLPQSSVPTEGGLHGRPLVQLVVNRYRREDGQEVLLIERVQILRGPQRLRHGEELETRSELVELMGRWGEEKGIPVYLIRPEVMRDTNPELREKTIQRNYYEPVDRRNPRLWETVSLRVVGSAFLGSEDQTDSWFLYRGNDPAAETSGLEEAVPIGVNGLKSTDAKFQRAGGLRDY